MKIVLKGLKHLEWQENSTLIENAGTDHKRLKVLSCAICRTDAKMWAEGHRDLVFPRVLGHEMVVADEQQKKYAVWPGTSCGHCRFCRNGRENLCEEMKITGFHNDGGFSDHVSIAESSLIPLSDDINVHSACFTEPAGCVINAFNKLAPKPESRILIFGGGTVGLIASLYARHLDLVPLIIEKNEAKIEKISPFLAAAGIQCLKETPESEFDIVVNACPDFIAFCQGIAKIDKGGQLLFFSGLSKNENIETNLLNLMHYKEVHLSGAYGLTRADMQAAIGFIQKEADLLSLLIEEIVPPRTLPDLMARVLSGRYLKYIVDFSLSHERFDQATAVQTGDAQNHNVVQQAADHDKSDLQFKSGSLGHRIIEHIKPVGEELHSAATAKIDNKTKPLGALGILESIAVKMSCIQKKLSPSIDQKNVFVFAADHGITEEGVSAFPSEVTAQMVENFLNGGAAINVLCNHNHIDMQVVDMGVKKTFKPHSQLIDRKVNPGTKNFAVQNAMSTAEMQKALENGMQTFLDVHEKKPIDIIGLGEMGIGNTTSASAIISVITGITPAQATGRGTGVDDKGLQHKTEVIEKALAFHTVNASNGYDILTRIGGFEIAGMAGAALAAASKRVPIVLDGLISTAAGLVATVINPDIKGYLFSGHKSVEQAQKAALTHMGLTPLIDFKMRLGEGTGAALAIDMISAACKIMTQMASFDEAKVSRSD